MKRIMIMTAIICFCQVTVETCFANTALEVRPPDVYRAAYCAEVNRLLGFPKYEQINQDVTDKEIPLDEMILTINREPEIPDVRNDPISKLAAKLISGGDNLEFVDTGIKDARRDINSISSSELTQCKVHLEKILSNYNWMPCGYGTARARNRSQSEHALATLNLFIK